MKTPKSKVEVNASITTVVKVVLVMLIAAAPFAKFSPTGFLNTLPAKVAILLLIVATCFVDFQIALLATVAFLILLINMNAGILDQVRKEPKDTFAQQQASDEGFARQFQPLITDANATASGNVVCNGGTHRTDMNKDVLQHMVDDKVHPVGREAVPFVDDKIKPYDVYIQMMTSDEQLAKAQGALV